MTDSTTTTDTAGDAATGDNAQQPTQGQGNGTPTPADVARSHAQNSPAGTDTAQGTSTQAGSGDSGDQPQDVDSLPAWAQKLIRDTRAEAASHRTKANDAAAAQQQTLDAIAQALGLKNSDDDPDPEALTAQVATEQERAREAQLHLAVWRNPGQADPAALLDSNSFLTAVKDIDPTDTKALTEAIEAAVQDNPRLKATQAAAKSGNDLTGGTGEDAITQERFNAMTPGEKNQLHQTQPAVYNRLTGRS